MYSLINGATLKTMKTRIACALLASIAALRILSNMRDGHPGISVYGEDGFSIATFWTRIHDGDVVTFVTLPGDGTHATHRVAEPDFLSPERALAMLHNVPQRDVLKKSSPYRLLRLDSGNILPETDVLAQIGRLKRETDDGQSLPPIALIFADVESD